MAKKSLNQTVTEVVDILKDAGLYLPELKFQVEMLAANLMIYRKLTADVMKLKSMTIVEKTGGQPREKAHPLVGLQANAAAQLRKDLSLLLMNYQKRGDTPTSDRSRAADTLETLLNSVPD